MKRKVVCNDEQNPPEPSDLKSDLAVGVKVTGYYLLSTVFCACVCLQLANVPSNGPGVLSLNLSNLTKNTGLLGPYQSVHRWKQRDPIYKNINLTNKEGKDFLI